MKYIAAYLLLVLGGKEKPSEAEIEKVLTASGGKVEKERIKLLLDEMKDKSINEVLAKGKLKLSSAPVGGGGGAGGAGGAKTEEKKEEETKEEEKPEEDEESDADMGLGLFGGGGDSDDSD